jgi:hypothetical protein
MSGQLCEGGSDRRTSVDIYDFEERIGRAGLAKVDFEGLPLSRILRSPKWAERSITFGLAFHHGPPAPPTVARLMG